MHFFIRTLKRVLYFQVAGYFKHWASIMLDRWQPTVILVTGSSGKTTLLHLLEAQLGERAVYSHHANSAFGVPFHVLGLKRTSFALYEWPLLLIKAPFNAYRKAIPSQKLYVVEADAERPGEAELIASLLRPSVVMWLSLGQAHGASYDALVKQGTFGSVFDAIAFEYGYTFAHAKGVVIANGDNEYIMRQLARAQTQKIVLNKDALTSYEVDGNTTRFTLRDKTYTIPALVPKDTSYAIDAIEHLCGFLKITVDQEFKGFVVPPGRSSVFEGKKGTVLIDSSYNATIEGVKAMLEVLRHYPAEKKWVVLGDMLEQGTNESEEHTKLVDLVVASGVERVVLVGPRLGQYTLPGLSKVYPEGKVVSFTMPAPAYEYLEKEIEGGEVIMFKGARFLEGVVEKLLAHPEDVAKLCRRESVWVKRRKQWGL